MRGLLIYGLMILVILTITGCARPTGFEPIIKYVEEYPECSAAGMSKDGEVFCMFLKQPLLDHLPTTVILKENSTTIIYGSENNINSLLK